QDGLVAFHQRGSPAPALFAPKIISPRFDFAKAKTWLGHCTRNHKRQHKRLSSTNEHPVNISLIDCLAMEVIAPPKEGSHPYAALSYVWGAAPSALSSFFSPRKPMPTEATGTPSLVFSKLPSTIRDAIQVTLALGFCYLWVDLFCIDQSDAAKHEQIKQMDMIYQSAEVTIIAAAGRDPTHGLPGVSRDRLPQPQCSIGNIELLSTMPHPHTAIRSSVWDTRGWTYQEAVLSRRRLVFTDQQVYYECNSMNCHESLESNLDSLHLPNKSKFRGFLQAGMFGRDEHHKYGAFEDTSASRPTRNFARFQSMVEQYSARHLTFEEDTFNAFVGIAEHLRQSVNQIWGVPLRLCQSAEETERFFVDGLTWSHVPPSITTHSPPIPPRRRELFKCPSWSWCGWTGPIEFTKGLTLSKWQSIFDSHASVALERDDGIEFPLSEYLESTKTEPQYACGPEVIRLRALVVLPSAFKTDTSGCLTAFGGHHVEVDNSTHPVLGKRKRLCVFLGVRMLPSYFLILDPHDGFWRRVGLMKIRDFYALSSSKTERSR
ncbi:heterokaryon incompatibility protein-domain-containing protein, partial [Plectosphaerella plurivora]